MAQQNMSEVGHFLMAALTIGFFGCFLIVGGIMLISPRSYFALPKWMRLQGGLVEPKYSSGWGAVQVRILGAVMVAFALFPVFSLFFGRRVP